MFPEDVWLFARTRAAVDGVSKPLHDLEKLIETGCLLALNQLDLFVHRTVEFTLYLLSPCLCLCFIWNESQNFSWFRYFQSLIFTILLRFQTNIETWKFVFRLAQSLFFFFGQICYTFKYLKYFCHLFVDIVLILLELLHHLVFELIVILPHLLKQTAPISLVIVIASFQVVQ